MNAALMLTARDCELLQALSICVRLFSQRQILMHWWHGDAANARRRLTRLAQAQWLQQKCVLARPIPRLTAPLINWRPGDPEPDCGQVAWRCQSRWRKLPPRPSVAWIVTERAAQRWGGINRGSLKHPAQATHDLGVSAVWLHLHQTAPQWAAAWRSEDVLAHTRHGEKLPDAFLVDSSQRVQWVIEFGGSYDTDRVSAFHQDCEQRQLPYQLW